MYRSYLASYGVFPEETVPYTAVNFVCPWEEVSSGFSYVAILNCNFKIKNFCSSKDTIKKVKRQPTERKKIFANHIFDRKLVSRIEK